MDRIISKRKNKDGSSSYLIKWRDLPYDQITWENEVNIPLGK